MKDYIRNRNGRKTYILSGKVVTQAEFEKFYPPRRVVPGIAKKKKNANWPLKSVGMAVNPEDVPAAMNLDRERGAPPTEYTPGGRPILRDPAHRRAYLRAHGMHDRNSNDG